jgi:hypothetical protein
LAYRGANKANHREVAAGAAQHRLERTAVEHRLGDYPVPPAAFANVGPGRQLGGEHLTREAAAALVGAPSPWLSASHPAQP